MFDDGQLVRVTQLSTYRRHFGFYIYTFQQNTQYRLWIDTPVSTKDLVLRVIIDTLKHNRASEVIHIRKEGFVHSVMEIC